MGLNLLPSAAKFQTEKIGVKKKVRLSVMILLFLEVLMLLSVFVWRFMVNGVWSKIVQKHDESLLVYETLSDKLLMSYKIKQSVEMLDEVLSDRFEYGEVFKKIEGLFSSEIDLGSFELKGRKSFVLEGIATGVESIAEVESVILRIEEGQDKDFKSVEFTNLSMIGNDWKFKMEVTLR